MYTVFFIDFLDRFFFGISSEPRYMNLSVFAISCTSITAHFFFFNSLRFYPVTLSIIINSYFWLKSPFIICFLFLSRNICLCGTLNSDSLVASHVSFLMYKTFGPLQGEGGGGLSSRNPRNDSCLCCGAGRKPRPNNDCTQGTWDIDGHYFSPDTFLFWFPPLELNFIFPLFSPDIFFMSPLKV